MTPDYLGLSSSQRRQFLEAIKASIGEETYNHLLDSYGEDGLLRAWIQAAAFQDTATHATTGAQVQAQEKKRSGAWLWFLIPYGVGLLALVFLPHLLSLTGRTESAEPWFSWQPWYPLAALPMGIVFYLFPKYSEQLDQLANFLQSLWAFLIVSLIVPGLGVWLAITLYKAGNKGWMIASGLGYVFICGGVCFGIGASRNDSSDLWRWVWSINAIGSILVGVGMIITGLVMIIR
jgi:hypothetical protein